MKVLIGCEFSGIVRNAFLEKNHDAWSCDLLPTETPGPHIQCDILDILDKNWDLAIFHPPCTNLCSSGARWWKNKKQQQKNDIDFVKKLLTSNIPKIALENPVGILSKELTKPTQIIQPWQFGDPFIKTTCLWLKNLPKLEPTKICETRIQQCWKEPPSPERWKNRSRTYVGIARAMAIQWG